MNDEQAPSGNEVATAFLLLSEAQVLDPDAWIAALETRGIAASDAEVDDQITSVTLSDGASAFYLLVDAPHPDVLANDPDPSSVPPAHAILTITGGPDTSRDDQDRRLAWVTAAAVSSSPAVAAMLGFGVLFRRADAFVDHIEHLKDGERSALVMVDFTVDQESDGRVSVLSHGLSRYGREEFYIVGPDAQTTWSFTLTMSQWMLDDPSKVLPTGDTVGRSAEEKLLVERIPSPIAGNPDVIRLQLP